jgi:hypothetical protein
MLEARTAKGFSLSCIRVGSVTATMLISNEYLTYPEGRVRGRGGLGGGRHGVSRLLCFCEYYCLANAGEVCLFDGWSRRSCGVAVSFDFQGQLLPSTGCLASMWDAFFPKPSLAGRQRGSSKSNKVGCCCRRGCQSKSALNPFRTSRLSASQKVWTHSRPKAACGLRQRSFSSTLPLRPSTLVHRSQHPTNIQRLASTNRHNQTTSTTPNKTRVDLTQLHSIFSIEILHQRLDLIRGISAPRPEWYGSNSATMEAIPPCVTAAC